MNSLILGIELSQASKVLPYLCTKKKTMALLQTFKHACPFLSYYFTQTLANGGPYPLLIEGSEGGFWTQNGEYMSAYGEDGVWRAPEISTEHYTIQTDKTVFVYGRYFMKQVC